MEGETEIEKNIKEFVFSKINETVYLDISKKNLISIKQRSKTGTIALAMFWLRVLRHQNNYPMPKYPYKELYDKQGTNKSIMDHYDAPVQDPQPRSEAFKQYTESWKKLEDEYNIKRAEEDSQQSALEDRALLNLTDRENEAAQQSTEETGDVTKTADDSNTNAVQAEIDETLDDLAEEMELMTLDKWPSTTVEEQLNKLRTSSVRDGSTYIYKLWKSLLHHWFSDPDCKVYLVTPFLDASRLADICQIILQHKLEANLDAFYVRQQCDHERRIQEVKRDALKQFKDAKDQMFIEYKIFSNVIYPMRRFHAKFIAGVKNGVAHVVITSANFHGDHFDCSNMETIQYQTMSEARFIHGFLGQINSSVTVHK